MDRFFRIDVLRKTENPNQLIYLGLHQCYSSELVSLEKMMLESLSGEIAIERLLRSDRIF